MAMPDNGILSTQTSNMIDVFAASNPFGDVNAKYQFAEGMSIGEMLEQLCPEGGVEKSAHVYLGPHYIPCKNWRLVRPLRGATVSIRIVPGRTGGGGGKNPLKAIFSIAIMVVASTMTGGLASSLAIGLSGGMGPATALTTAIAGGLVRFGVGAVANLAFNALAPPGKPKLNSPLSGANSSPTLFIQGARNQINPRGVIPVVLGRHRIVPPQATYPYTETFGGKQFVRQLFCWGYGKINLSELKVGDTLLSSFIRVETEHVLNGNSDAPIGLIPSTPHQLDLSVQLNPSVQNIRETVGEVDELNFDITFPSGLNSVSKKGNPGKPHSVNFRISYRIAGTSVWTHNNFTFNSTQITTLRYSKRYVVPRGKYEVSVTRTSANDPKPQKVSELAFWTALRTFQYGSPVRKAGLALTALRMQATDQLNGVVDQLNGVVESIVPDWDHETGTWVERATSNCASLYRYVLQGLPNARAKSDSGVALDNLQEWHDYCRINGLTFNHVIDYEISVDEVLRMIAAAGRAVPAKPDGKWGVVIDCPRLEATQHVTPHNSWGYSYERSFPDIPHAFIVPFLNERKGFVPDERIVYADGYNKNTATKFEGIEFPGVTDPDLVWVHAREHFASLILRPERHSLYMDAEHLAAKRGDLVYFSHDVILVGLGTGRIKNIITDGADVPNVTGFVLEEPVVFEEGFDYVLRIRLNTRISLVKRVTAPAGETYEVAAVTPFPVLPGLKSGNIFSFGRAGLESLELIIKEVVPGPDWSARLICVNHAPEIVRASEGVIPDFNSGITAPPEFKRPSAPIIKSVQTDEAVQIINIDGSVSNRLVITLENPNGQGMTTLVRLRMIGDDEFKEPTVLYSSEETVVVEGLDEGDIFDLRVYYKRNNGLALFGDMVSEPAQRNGITFIGTTGNPPTVTGFDITVRGETVFLRWNKSTVIDLDGYELRFTPNVIDPAWESAVPCGPPIPKDVTSAPVVSAIGSYLIKAFDRSGNKSSIAAIVTTTIGNIADVDVVEVIQEEDFWDGTHSGTRIDSGSLKLSGTDSIDDWDNVDLVSMWDIGGSDLPLAVPGEIDSPHGIYYFGEKIDLGAVYTSVVSVSLKVSGENVLDLIDGWADIDGREDWSGSNPSQYDVVMEIRTTVDDPEDSPTWSPWRALLVGEYTARAMEFRARLLSYETNISPVLNEAHIVINMPDREEAEDDIVISPAGQFVEFPNAFWGFKGLGLAVDGLEPGDTWENSPKTEEGFYIRFFNEAGVGVERSLSYVAKGYGYKYN